MADPERSALRDLVRLLGFVRPYLAMLALAIVFSGLYGGGLSGRALLLQPLVDDVALPSASLSELDELLGDQTELSAQRSEEERTVLRERVRDNFYSVLLAGVMLIVLMPLMRLVRDYSSYWIMQRLAVDLQQAIGEKLLRLPLAHHVRERRGDFVARVTNDTSVANRAHVVVFGDLVQDAGIVFVSVGFAIWLSWQLALVLLLVGPLTALVLPYFGRRIRVSSARRQEQVSEVTQRLMQMLSGIKVIKAFHGEERERAAFRVEVLRYFRRSMKVLRNRVLSRTAVELLTQGSFVAVLLVGVWAILEGYWGLTLGKLMAFAAISAMLYRPLRSVTTIYNTLQDAIPAAARVFEVLDAPEVTPDEPDALELERIREAIRYEGVSFRYERETVLDQLDLELRAGEVVALVGSSGAGKTTIADLLLRFHEPDAGRITMDGVDLRRIRRESLHALTGIVTQEAFLFDDTIAGNIAYGRPEASQAEIEQAARAANIDDFVAGLPEGYQTEVGELGGKLSGGQRQRLTIARAILRDPQLLIFDEATSALDAKAEQQVQKAIANLMQGRTVLLIAHRLSTVKAADRIAVIEKGQVSMSGTHEELLARGGLYSELVDAQLVA